jgi:hypothetical protein
LGVLLSLDMPQRQKQKLSTRTRPETKSPPIRLGVLQAAIESLARTTLVFVRKGCSLSQAPLVLSNRAARIARS